MADSPKDDQASSSESCLRYYFPEIPCGMQSDPMAATPLEPFVNGPLDPNGKAAAPTLPPPDPEAAAQLIEDAFKKGKDQGRAEMMDTQQETVNKATLALKAAVEEMVRIRQQDVDRLETATVRLALAIAKKIIGHESEHGTLIEHVVKTAMEKVADPRNLTLRLNPIDVETVNGFQQELLLEDDFNAVLRLEADEAIQPGGCIIETQLGDVDARVDQQIKVMEDLLTAQLPKIAPKG